jgi:predicted RNA-binding Zn-ribbon protein involved in translation (DUF1610 family)
VAKRCFNCGRAILENEQYFKCSSCHNHFHLRCKRCESHPNAGRYLVDPSRPSPPLRISNNRRTVRPDRRSPRREESNWYLLIWLVIIVVVLVLIVSIFFGNKSPAPKPRSQNNTTLPIVQRLSPLDRCGDKDPGGINTWYPVFVNRIDESTFNYIKQTYCRDALIKYRSSVDRQSIQVASFLNNSKANQFANKMLRDRKINSGEVGSPDQLCFYKCN